MPRTGKRAAGTAGLVAVLALTCLGCGAWETAPAVRDEGGAARTAEVPCREALRFADQERLPSGAEGASCTMQHGIDTLYDIRFRIGRTDLDTWLADAYPGMELRTGCVQEEADRCGLLTLDPYAEGGAVAVELTVRDGSDGHALVHYRPFNT
ncbi:hypothetical protein [Streptomyces sp. NPDC017991]|uniref:hypothetical protein n=1 Tax=Streptomyces sp. NPDC017991 TaxID=3365026 RepID=UPI003793553B